MNGTISREIDSVLLALSDLPRESMAECQDLIRGMQINNREIRLAEHRSELFAYSDEFENAQRHLELLAHVSDDLS